MAVYATPTGPSGEGESGQQGAAESDARMRVALRAFGDGFGLKVSEDHRSAGEDGIVAIEVTEAPSKRGFIPYTRKALSWHTDGYYNPPEETIRGMLLHCVRPARSGGVNALFDPEIAYMRLRDRDPALVAALMHPEAMSIPEAVEEDGSVRPVSVGPVFIIDPRTGSLTMRYTARARNVVWRDDEDTRRAVAALADILADESDEFMFRYRLEAGEGLISNNVLHTRTAFENEDDAGRLLYRVRYRQRVAGT
ncbi:MAG: TauD/TfdA family dioxygenase [Hyphomicrobiaceae bacterium]